MLSQINRRPIICACLLIIHLSWFFSLTSCSDENQAPLIIEKSQEKVLRKSGYAIPVLNSAREQLNFALSRFSDYKERKIALELVGELFPTARLEKAEALLELAYLSLGKDFRLADRQKCLQAISKYEAIIDRYQDFAPICAKARWYIAWIYMDLLHDKEKGIENYRRVVRKYPHEGFLPSPRLRWQEIFARQAKSETTFLSTVEQWAAIALLELARNLDTPEQKLEAVKQLMSNYPTSRAVIYGLMALLDQHPLSRKSVQMAKAYLSSGLAYPPLAVYLKDKLEAVGSRVKPHENR